MTITLAKVADVPQLWSARPAEGTAVSTRRCSSPPERRGNGDLPRGRRPSHRGHGIWHSEHSQGSKNLRPRQCLCGGRETAGRWAQLSIDLLPGPSELLVLADATADANFAAADLLAQAEHGSGHERVWLVTTSGKILKAVEKELTRQLAKLPRRALIERSLENAWLIQVKSLDEAVRLANSLAPEHCEIFTRGARKLSERIRTAGAIFIGAWSPTVLGDYVAGPSHTLPTGGAGKSFAGLTVDQFQRRTSLVEYNRASLERALPVVKEFASLEGGCAWIQRRKALLELKQIHRVFVTCSNTIASCLQRP